MSACFRICAIGVAVLLPTHAAIAGAPTSLGDNLVKLAAERDIVILYAPELVAGRSGRVLPPGLSARAAIEALLIETGASVREVRRGVFVLEKRGDAASPRPMAAREDARTHP